MRIVSVRNFLVDVELLATEVALLTGPNERYVYTGSIAPSSAVPKKPPIFPRSRHSSIKSTSASFRAIRRKKPTPTASCTHRSPSSISWCAASRRSSASVDPVTRADPRADASVRPSTAASPAASPLPDASGGGSADGAGLRTGHRNTGTVSSVASRIRFN